MSLYMALFLQKGKDMKKYFSLFALTISLTISSVIFTAQKQIDSLKYFGQQFGADIGNYDLFYGKPSVLSQQPYRTWLDAFSAAETFVMDNSKNLARMTDSDIKNTLDVLKKSHNEMILAMEKIPTMQHNQQLQQMEKLLQTINTNIEASITKLNKVNFTLSNKIEAKKVLNEMKNVLKWIITYKLIPITQKRIGMV